MDSLFSPAVLDALTQDYGMSDAGTFVVPSRTTTAAPSRSVTTTPTVAPCVDSQCITAGLPPHKMDCAAYQRAMASLMAFGRGDAPPAGYSGTLVDWVLRPWTALAAAFDALNVRARLTGVWLRVYNGWSAARIEEATRSMWASGRYGPAPSAATRALWHCAPAAPLAPGATETAVGVPVPAASFAAESLAQTRRMFGSGQESRGNEGGWFCGQHGATTADYADARVAYFGAQVYLDPQNHVQFPHLGDWSGYLAAGTSPWDHGTIQNDRPTADDFGYRLYPPLQAWYLLALDLRDALVATTARAVVESAYANALLWNAAETQWLLYLARLSATPAVAAQIAALDAARLSPADVQAVLDAVRTQREQISAVEHRTETGVVLTETGITLVGSAFGPVGAGIATGVNLLLNLALTLSAESPTLSFDDEWGHHPMFVTAALVPYPGTPCPATSRGGSATLPKDLGLSTGGKIAAGVVGAGILGTIIYAVATR